MCNLSGKCVGDQWHLELIARCPNRVLLELIHQFMERTRRDEVALMRETKNVELSTSISTTRSFPRCVARSWMPHATSSREHAKRRPPIINWLKSRPLKVRV